MSDDFSYSIDSPYLVVNRIKLNNAYTVSAMNRLKRENMLFPTRYMQSRRLLVPGDAYGFEYNSLFSGPTLPKALVSLFIRTNYLNGSITSNPLSFERPQLQSFEVRVGLQKFPNQQIDLRPELNMLALQEAYKVLGSFPNDLGVPAYLDRESFNNNTAFILCTDLSRSQDVSVNVRNQIVDASEISVSAKLSEPNAHSFTAIFIGLFFSQVEYTAFGQIITPWS